MPGIVLLYHRVAELREDPWGLSVTPRHFAEHLDALRRVGSIVTLSDMVTRPSEQELQIAISFDDGYADNLHAALPVMERFDVPGTFFVATRLVNRGQEFWWDEIEQLTLAAELLPRRFVAEAATFDLDAFDIDASDAVHEAQWRAWHAGSSARQKLFMYLWTACRELSSEGQQNFLEGLRIWAHGEPTPRLRPSHRPMSGEELTRLAASPLATLGAHTRTHPRLASWPRDVQGQEIQGSREDLLALGLEVSCFAYPFGGRSDYSLESTSEVQCAGFAVGCAAWSGVVGRGSSPFEVPRLSIQDCDGDQLLKQLDCLKRSREMSAPE